jgi:putative glutamine amidotransferase
MYVYKMATPLIALTASSARRNGGAARVGVNEAYVRAIQSAGLVPVVVPPSLGPDEARAVIRGTAGLLLSGGEDVDPSRYGAVRHSATQTSHAGRDATEMALVDAARDARRPVLAICRGLQLLNVALGGTLVQDLASERPSPITHPRDPDRTRRVHDVTVAPGSRLATIVGCQAMTVNSLHHQAVDQLAPALRATAHAPDGVIEGAETTDDWWVLAVQWHPEELIDTSEPWDRAIFNAFAQVCGV